MEKSDKMRSKRNFDVAFLSGENETEDEEKEARKRQERETENTEEHRDSICKFVAIRLFSRRRWRALIKITLFHFYLRSLSRRIMMGALRRTIIKGDEELSRRRRRMNRPSVKLLCLLRIEKVYAALAWHHHSIHVWLLGMIQLFVSLSTKELHVVTKYLETCFKHKRIKNVFFKSRHSFAKWWLTI